jgi:type II secretory pathway pseudopilin PulG
MVVVVSIVLILISIGAPAVSSMWNQTIVQNAQQQISNLLKTAKTRSALLPNIAYGVLFYVDPQSNRQFAIFIDALPYPVELDETWPDVRDRFVIDVKNPYSFPMQDIVRVAQLDLLEWIDSESEVRRFWAQNDDYRAGNQRSFFAIIFQAGRQSLLRSFVLYDEDADEDDLGDLLGLPVGDIVGDHGGVLRSILLDENEERREIPTAWGFLIYDENDFKEFRPDNLDLVLYLPYYLTPSGRVITLEREK